MDNSIEISQEEYSNLCTMRFYLKKYLDMPSVDGNIKRKELRKELAILLGIKNFEESTVKTIK